MRNCVVYEKIAIVPLLYVHRGLLDQKFDVPFPTFSKEAFDLNVSLFKYSLRRKVELFCFFLSKSLRISITDASNHPLIFHRVQLYLLKMFRFHNRTAQKHTMIENSRLLLRPVKTSSSAVRSKRPRCQLLLRPELTVRHSLGKLLCNLYSGYGPQRVHRFLLP